MCFFTDTADVRKPLTASEDIMAGSISKYGGLLCLDILGLNYQNYLSKSLVL